MNQNADALSRRQYDSDDKQQPQIDVDDGEIIAKVTTDSFPSPDNTHLSITAPVDKTAAIVTFNYDQQPSINEVSTSKEDDVPDFIHPDTPPLIERETRQTLPDLQWQCPDLQPILRYLQNSSLPEDQQSATKLVAEAQQYVITDNILFHFMPVRTKTVP